MESTQTQTTPKMRKVTAFDLFGINADSNYSNPTIPESKIASYSKQGEYGPKKFIKP